MCQQIKQLADDALALQNKDRMDASLREIGALCDQAAEQKPAAADGADTLDGGDQ